MGIVTDEQAAKMIQVNCHSGDNEGDHGKADEILCEVLKTLGYARTVAAWDEVGKWYA